MKKKIVLVLVIMGFAAASAFAGGDKNCIRHQGDNGQGSVVQHQIRNNIAD